MVKNLPANAGSIRDMGRSPGGGHGNILKYSCLENPIDCGAWRATIHRVTELHMTNLDSILKSRDVTLSTKVSLVKAMVFPVVMYGYESWTIKKAEC